MRARPARPALPTLRRALGLVRPYRLTVAGYLTTVIIASLTGLGPPLLIQQVLDRAIPQQDAGMLNLLVLAMVGLVILGALNGTAQSYLSSLASHSVVYDLRSRVYRHLSGQSLGWFTANRTGDSVSRISSDVGAVQGVITDTLGGSLGNLITVASTMAVMLTMGWRLARFAMVFVPVFIVPAQRVGRSRAPRSVRSATAPSTGIEQRMTPCHVVLCPAGTRRGPGQRETTTWMSNTGGERE